jgi:hypothetical protein
MQDKHHGTSKKGDVYHPFFVGEIVQIKGNAIEREVPWS